VCEIVTIGYLVEQDSALRIVDPASGIRPVGRKIAWLRWSGNDGRRLGSSGAVGGTKAIHCQAITGATILGLVAGTSHVAIGKRSDSVLAADGIPTIALSCVLCARIDEIELATRGLAVGSRDIGATARDLAGLITRKRSTSSLVVVAAECVPAVSVDGGSGSRGRGGRSGKGTITMSAVLRSCMRAIPGGRVALRSRGAGCGLDSCPVVGSQCCTACQLWINI
jgi:hypothetical protein